MASGIYVDHDEILAACDGRRILVVRNEGTRFKPVFRIEFAFEREDHPSRDLGTDRPGRLDAMPGGPRSAVEQTDFHERAEEDFLRKAADALDEALDAGTIRSLVVAAPPRALGILRRRFSADLKRAIRAEIDADIAHMPITELQTYFHRSASKED
jgi:protein required for attachment to host cells